MPVPEWDTSATVGVPWPWCGSSGRHPPDIVRAASLGARLRNQGSVETLA